MFYLSRKIIMDNDNKAQSAFKFTIIISVIKTKTILFFSNVTNTTELVTNFPYTSTLTNT